MAKIVGSRCVLAVRDLKVSTSYYTDVLGFSRDPIDAEGWRFLTRDSFRVMLGECPDEKPASELGDHSYFAYWNVDDVDQLYDEVKARGALVNVGTRRQALGSSRIWSSHAGRASHHVWRLDSRPLNGTESG